MKWQFLIFFSIALGVYFAMNFYIFIRGWQALMFYPKIRLWLALTFWIFAAVYPVGRLMENFTQNVFTDALVWRGSFWLGVMVYLFFLAFGVDIFRIIAKLSGHAVSYWVNNHLFYKLWAGAVFALLGFALAGFGLWNALTPVVTKLEIVISKDGGIKKEWNIIVVSDIHMYHC